MVTKLIVASGKSAGRSISIKRNKLLIGRSEECDVRPLSDEVSRRHCVVTVGPADAWIEDLKSRNGTFVGLDAATGAEKWSRTFEGVEIDANGLMLDNAIFFTTHTYRLLRLDPATGEIQPVNVQPPSSGN